MVIMPRITSEREDGLDAGHPFIVNRIRCECGWTEKRYSTNVAESVWVHLRRDHKVLTPFEA